MTFTERFKDLTITRIIWDEEGVLQIEGVMLDGKNAWLRATLSDSVEIVKSTIPYED